MNPLKSFIGISRSKLAFKFSLAALLIIITMGIGIYFIADETISQNLYEAHKEKGLSIVSSLASNAADPLLLDNIVRLQLLLKNTEQGDKEIVYIFIIDSSGNVAAHTLPGGFPHGLEKINNPKNDQAYSSQLLDTEKGHVLNIAFPILQGSLGYVHAGFSLESIEHKHKRTQKHIFWTFALASLLAILASVVFSRYITKPLTALAQGARNIGQGNLAHRLDIVGNDEIGVAADTFNRMAESLQRDIEKRIHAEKEKTILKTQLIQAQKMEAIGTLAGGIAHDFNNLLTVILGNTELSMIDLPEGSSARYQLEEVLQATRRARDLVRQILSFSRKVDQKLQPIRPILVVREVIKLLRSTIPTTVEILQDIDPECGTIIADPTQIHQVLMNLATNAVYAMREDGVLAISLGLTSLDADDLKHRPDMAAGHYIRLSVSDTGSGMDEQILERIFEPFFTTKDIDKGTGMGLSVVHGIVTAHHGMITVDSTPGQGTTFHVYFPKAESEKTEQAEAIQALPTGNERLLIIDDEESIVNMWENALSRLGYQVTTKTSSTDALAAFSSRPGDFDLVITDQTMPEMHGAELSQKLMNIRPDIPVILCTGYSSKVTIEEALGMKIRKFFEKPVDIAQLAKAIRYILDKK